MSIENLAVRPEFQRCGIGRQIIDVLASKLRKVSGLNQLTADVADFNIGAQLFFSACGFSAVGVFWGKYRDGSDAYCFVRTADTSPQTPKTSLNATQR
jgi:ribosomal protein S18 acetylase RimI-like enzyme